jgi:magnesium chelatase family protein
MDLLVNVTRPTDAELRANPRIDSAAAAQLVAEARERQRFRLSGTAARCNGEMDGRIVKRQVRLDGGAQQALGQAYAVGALSARGRHRVLRVARTIADLERRDLVTQADVLTALALRQRSGGEEALAA